MARKGNVLWTVSKSTEYPSVGEWSNPYTGIQTYALRADGVLIENYKTKEGNKPKHDYGWKIRTRTPKANVLEILKGKGYS